MGSGILRLMAGTTRVAVALLVVVTAASCGGDGTDGRAATPTPAPTAARESPATSTAARGVRLKRIGSFDAPVYLTSPPGDRARQFVVEQAGRVMAIRDGRKLEQPFLDIRGQVTSGGEQGLLSIAFAPDYATSGRFYVYFTDEAGDQRIVEYRRRDADRADPGSARLVLRMADSEPNHNGGLLLFGPDGLLYVGTGDGGGGGDQHGSRGNAQDLGSLLGKILRIDPRGGGGRPYRVPAGNPFVGRSGARSEVYSYGLRNPWRFSFDRKTGDLAIGDVGQNAVEEIDFVRRGKGRGANFGWRPFEGRSAYARGERAPGNVRPVIVRKHSDGNCSITGGVIVRDPQLSGLLGRYVFGDYCTGRVESARLSPRRARDVRRTSLNVPSLSSFGEDAQGHVYALSLDGPVYRIVPR
jgi:glucose/arabinose dehydrogenase